MFTTGTSHKADTKRITKNMLVLTFRMLFQIGVYLYSLRVLLEQLGVEDYGIYDLLTGVVLVLSFLNNALQTSTLRFITYALGTKNFSYLERSFGASLTLHLLLAALILVLGESVGLWYLHTHLQIGVDRYETAFTAFQYLLIGGVALVGTIPFHLLVLAHERITAYAYITILDVSLKLLCAYSLQFFHSDRLSIYAFLMLCELLVVRFIYMLYCKKSFPDVRLQLFKRDTLLREILHFMGWSTLGNFAFVANTQGLNLLLNFLGGSVLGPIYNAARGIAYQVQSAVNSCCGSLLTSVNPQITKSYAQKDLTTMAHLLQFASRSAFFLALLMSLPLFMETEQIFSLWLKEIPPYAVLFTRLLLLVALVESLSTPLATATEATGHVRRYNWLLSLPMLSTLPLAYWGVQKSGQISGVYISLLLTSMLTQSLRIYLTHRLLGFSLRSYGREVVLRLIAVLIAASSLPFLLEILLPNTLVISIFNIIVSLFWTGLCIFLLGFLPNEQRFILNKFKRHNR